MVGISWKVFLLATHIEKKNCLNIMTVILPGLVIVNLKEVYKVNTWDHAVDIYKLIHKGFVSWKSLNFLDY